MFKLLKEVRCFAPCDIGKKDILIIFDKIGFIEDDINGTLLPGIEVIPCRGCIAVPGFIDQHVHIVGGGGEEGPHSRTPEIMLSNIIQAGVTTVVGVLGFDSITRGIAGLLAKARALENEGISTYIYSGSYGTPMATLTGSVLTDIALIDKVVGVGEIAISDFRSSYPSVELLRKLAGEAKRGGMLGGKAGLVHLHVGDGKEGLNPLFQLLKESDFPKEMFLPTHINRTRDLFDQGIKYLSQGGRIDLTAGEKNGVSVPAALAGIMKDQLSLEQVTITSDGNGSVPGRYGWEIGQVADLFEDFCRMAREGKIPFPQLLKTVTMNPAKNLKIFPQKGILAPGSDADILVLREEDFSIELLLARGKFLVKDQKLVQRGTFEIDGRKEGDCHG
ncbi:beta-aspartyl-peptidase [Dehalobacterium formicoaceticum]|uniref:Isoaspartyl dipeptidase n=1 Tax=Dehalobacterium formicoaceticum TaxID=51515 RepID=A0ABT1Y5Z5_9FIRM|nr:beta-aspartyl-peptidase [Dehalobacterium formicoaceticum]MCR6546302.1 beta-aspartyl-peptidase [Dehalobacterium formicoaceticum]